MASTIRTFIAVPLPADLIRNIRSYLGELDRRYPEYRWQSPEQMHITINFLGQIPDSQTGEVCRTTEEVVGNWPRFTGNLGAVGAFPKPGRPRILWLGLDQGHGQLTRLHHDLDKALDKFDIERERKRFRPHLTLGRLNKQDRWSDAVVADLDSGLFPTLNCDSRFDVDEIVVYSSFLESAGAVHTPMTRIQLADKPAKKDLTG